MPVDIDKAEEKVKAASGFFDTLNAFIKKHPIWFAIIVIVALSELGYLGWLGSNDEPVEPEYNEYYTDPWEYVQDTTYQYEE